MRKAVTTVLATLASVCLFVTILFTCLQLVAFDENRYAAEQQKLGLPQAAGVSAGAMKTIMHELLLYCRGDRSNLDMQAVIGGQPREVFSQREKDHMVDVQKLFVRGFHMRTILIVAFLFLVLVLVYFERKRTLRVLAKGWVIAAAAMGLLLAAVGICFAVDFEGAWTQFHHIFFTNDLWLLYNDDMLIQMLLPLFDGIVMTILLSAAVVLAAVTAVAVIVLVKSRKRMDKPEPDDPDEPDKPEELEPSL